MSSLFIVGNGFDIAHGIPSKYNNFRDYIIKTFPKVIDCRDEVVFLEETDNICYNEFSAEILLHAMDKACGEDWSDFEHALSKINFNEKFPKPNHKENETENEDNVLMEKYLLYINELSKAFINCTKYWQDFFRIWIKDIEKSIEMHQYNSKDSLKNLFMQDDFLFFTFNYTKTLQVLYGIKKVTHIHNRCGQPLIFGHGEKNITYGNFSDSGLLFGSSSLDNMMNQFKKDTNAPLKKYSKFFKKLDNKIDKVYSYGFSYGKVDSIYIKTIISKISPTATWYFTNFEVQNKKELRIKKIKLRSYGFKGSFDIFQG